MSTRRQRGNDTGNWLAQYLRDNLTPHAEHVGAGRPGTDILGIPGTVWEVRARANFDPVKAMRDATKHGPTQLPIIVIRANGQGRERIHEWLFATPLGHGINLLRDAGYGAP